MKAEISSLFRCIIYIKFRNIVPSGPTVVFGGDPINSGKNPANEGLAWHLLKNTHFSSWWLPLLNYSFLCSKGAGQRERAQSCEWFFKSHLQIWAAAPWCDLRLLCFKDWRLKRELHVFSWPVLLAFTMGFWPFLPDLLLSALPSAQLQSRQSCP